MRKIFLIISCCIILAPVCFSGNVTPEKAARVAKNFCVERAVYEINFNNANVDPKLAFQRSVNGKAVYYIFSTSGHSFVIVAGDDRVVPILGYSFESDWRNDPLPLQLTDYLNNSEQQILYVCDHNLPDNADIRSDWARLTAASPPVLNSHRSVNSSVAPLLFSTWHQGSPFNNMCPLDTLAGHRAAVGCTAIAMAQVMYYYRWPVTGVGSRGYTIDPFGYLFADFGNTIYHWDQMTNAAITGDSATAMATLCYHCGVSVEMNYSVTGSSASSYAAANALKNYYRYSHDIQMIGRQFFPDTAWIDILQEQLNARKLVHYAGFGPSGGHGFVCDGYQDDYFHFNWGWNGNCDGYYYVTNLNPAFGNFTNGQTAIINIYPEGDYPPNCNTTNSYIAPNGSVDDGSGPQDYTGNNDCFYLIDPQVDPYDSISNVIIKFSRFDTEPGNDLLTIYDGPTVNSPVIGTWSGNTLPPAINSGGNKILLHFSTNNAEHRNGWFLTYESKHPLSYCSSMTELTSPGGTLEDGSGSKYYRNNCFCHWRIHPLNAQFIKLSFDQFSLENGSDFLEVYDYDTLTGDTDLLGHYTGHILPPELTSAKGAMFLVFKTNDSMTDQGWKVHYSTKTNGKGDDPVNDTGQPIRIWPNPASASIHIDFDEYSNQKAILNIRNILGEELLSRTIHAGERELDVSALHNGIYFVGITASDNRTACTKLIIQK